MSTMQVVLIIVIAIIVIAALVAGYVMTRRRSLRQRFGPEYDRVVEESGSRHEAERELRARERRHAELDLRQLSEESRRRYTEEWEEVQARFVDAPDEAVRAGDELVTRLVAERGYPTGDFDEQLADLSVEHAHTLTRYREAHEIAERQERGEATTEQLRQALMHYRALFGELVGESPVRAGETRADRADYADSSDRDENPADPVDSSETAVHNGRVRPASPNHEEEDHDALRR
jgi:hypothetical protein